MSGPRATTAEKWEAGDYKSAAGASSEIQLPVESMTVELTVTATREVNGKAGFKVPIVEVELGGGGSRERGRPGNAARWVCRRPGNAAPVRPRRARRAGR